MNTDINTTQTEEERNRYSRRSILRSEQIYGSGFQSPGGIKMTKKLCNRLALQPGLQVLEIGSGLGGTTFYLADEYDAKVIGMDMSENMIAISTERLQERHQDSVVFRQGDIVQAQLEPSTYDLVWTQDCLLYVSERPAVWHNVYQALKPGGQLLISDFCRSSGKLTLEFQNYVETCQYYLQDIPSYAQSLQDALFTDIIAEDITDEFIEGLRAGRAHLVDNSADFLQNFSQADLDHLIERWDQKIGFCEIGDWRWGLFIARK